MTGHNPLIFLDRPAAQLAVLQKNPDQAPMAILAESYMLLEEAGQLDDKTRRAMEKLLGSKESRAEAATLFESADKMYDDLADALRADGTYDLALEHFGRMPAAPLFDFPQEEYGLDAPHPRKLLGIPDLRGGFLFTYPAEMKKLLEEAHRPDELPDWAKRTPAEIVRDIWPRDHTGKYMKFAAQLSMPKVMWKLLYCAAAQIFRPTGSPELEWVITPFGSYPEVATSKVAYVFHSERPSFSAGTSAGVLFGATGGEDCIPWEEYVEIVKSVIPAEAYTCEDQGLVSAPLGEAVFGIKVDFGNYEYYEGDPTSGSAGFFEALKAGGKDHWDGKQPKGGGISEGQYVTIGGDPKSQQTEMRPWDPIGYTGPRRMIPFFNYWAERDTTHQIYISGGTGMERSVYLGMDDASCT